MLQYNGYTGKVTFDDEAGIFHGEVVGTRDVITFQGTSVDEIRIEFKKSIEDYLEFCAEEGMKPEKPYSGKFIVRMSPEDHSIVALAAKISCKSLNKWIAENIVDIARNELSHQT